ncbi:MAG: hypothetical protein P8X63_07835, partial [Desulfuromonadaceae bacterium]
MNDIHQLQSGNLPTQQPDLIVHCRQDGPLRLTRVSHRLAELVDRTPDELRGRELEQVFPDLVPSLSELARESLSRDRVLTDIRVRFPVRGLTLAADIVPAGLTEDYSGTLVHFLFRSISPPPTDQVPIFCGLVGEGAAIREVFRK